MGAKRLTGGGGGGRNVLNWDKSSRRQERNVLGGETSMVRNVLEPIRHKHHVSMPNSSVVMTHHSLYMAAIFDAIIVFLRKP